MMLSKFQVRWTRSRKQYIIITNLVFSNKTKLNKRKNYYRTLAYFSTVIVCTLYDYFVEVFVYISRSILIKVYKVQV